LRHHLEIDWVGLWEFDWHLKREAPELDAAARRAVALDVLSLVLERGEAHLGQFEKGRDGLVLWAGSNEEQVARVREEWESIGEPDIGDIGWLQDPNLRQSADK
jgi:hypothetical protein